MKLRSRLLDSALLAAVAAPLAGSFLSSGASLDALALASVSVSVPEPASLTLLAAGLGGLGIELVRRHRKGSDDEM